METRQKQQIVELLQDPEYRHEFFTELVNGFIAAQIKGNRDQRGWTQAQLGERAGMAQSRISAMEDVNYGNWSINTLRRLAEAFDLVLSVKFLPFSKALEEYGSFDRGALRQPPFEEDEALPSREPSAASVLGAPRRRTFAFGDNE